MPAKPKSTDFDLSKAIFGGLKQAASKPNVLNYDPHDKQLQFHRSTKNGRLYIGGNRSGKTVGGIVEDVMWSIGEHPYRELKFEPPILGRIVTVDFKNGWTKIIQPVLRQWIPASSLINGSWEDSWNGKDHILTFENGSQIEIMSHDQDLEAFAGVPRHWIHFDEECPVDIFNECKARLTDYGGHWWMTMTPVEGMTWTHEEIYEKSAEGQNPLIDVITVDMLENKHLKLPEVQEYLDGLNDQEVEIRRKGHFIPLGGLILKNLKPEEHFVTVSEDWVPPSSWRHMLSLDHGFSNPTAWLWHAISPDGRVVTYDEHYKSEMTVEQHAKVVLSKEEYYRKRYGITPELRIADPAIKQRQATTGYSIQIEYGLHGVNLALGKLRMVDAGLNRMNTYLQKNMWFVTQKCPNLQKEMKKYSFKRYDSSKTRTKNNNQEQPQKKDDHAVDSSRYFFSFMPELAPLKSEEKAAPSKSWVASIMGTGSRAYDPTLIYNIDTNFHRQGNNYDDDGEYHVIDENVGEF